MSRAASGAATLIAAFVAFVVIVRLYGSLDGSILWQMIMDNISIDQRHKR
jgi:hypothetical protein